MLKARFRSGVFVLLVLLGLCPAPKGVHAGGREDLVGMVRSGFRSAQESIRTLSASFAMDATIPDGRPLTKGSYWRAPGRIHVQENRPDGAVEDYLLANGEIRQVARTRAPGANRFTYRATRRPGSEKFTDFNIWCELLLGFYSPEKGNSLDFDALLEMAKDPPKAVRESLAGRDCIRLNFIIVHSSQNKETEYAIWHDVHCNFLARKVVTHRKDRAGHAEIEVVEFAELAPGVFVPVVSEARTFPNERLDHARQTRLSNVRVNQSVSDENLRLPPVPPGTQLNDWVRNTKYPIDEDWQPVGRGEPIQKYVAPANSDGKEATYRSQTTVETKPWSHWLAPASLLALAAAGGCWFYRRLRHQR